MGEKLNAWQAKNEKSTREFCNDLLVQLKQSHLDPLLKQLQGKEGAKMSFEEIIGGYNRIKEDYHNSAIGAKDVIDAVFFEFHPVRLQLVILLKIVLNSIQSSASHSVSSKPSTIGLNCCPIICFIPRVILLQFNM